MEEVLTHVGAWGQRGTSPVSWMGQQHPPAGTSPSWPSLPPAAVTSGMPVDLNGSEHRLRRGNNHCLPSIMDPPSAARAAQGSCSPFQLPRRVTALPWCSWDLTTARDLEALRAAPFPAALWPLTGLGLEAAGPALELGAVYAVTSGASSVILSGLRLAILEGH